MNPVLHTNRLAETHAELPFRVKPQTPLWVVFWLQGVLPNAILAREDSDAVLRGYLSLGFLAHALLAVRTIWNRTNEIDRTFAGALSRGMCVPWILNSAAQPFPSAVT